jgi:hypothetical protein
LPEFQSRPSTAVSTYYPSSIASDPLRSAISGFRDENAYYVVPYFLSRWVERTDFPLEKDAVLGKLNRLLALKDRIATLPDRTRAYGSGAPPNGKSMATAREILDALIGFDVEPDRVVASAEGGVSVVFLRGNRRASVECLNTGDIVASLVQQDGPVQAWEVTPHLIYASLYKVCGHLAEQPASA